MTPAQFDEEMYKAQIRAMYRFNKKHGYPFTLPEGVSPEILETPECFEEIIKAVEGREYDHRAMANSPEG
jgi:hypothetical protein